MSDRRPSPYYHQRQDYDSRPSRGYEQPRYQRSRDQPFRDNREDRFAVRDSHYQRESRFQPPSYRDERRENHRPQEYERHPPLLRQSQSYQQNAAPFERSY